MKISAQKGSNILLDRRVATSKPVLSVSVTAAHLHQRPQLFHLVFLFVFRHFFFNHLYHIYKKKRVVYFFFSRGTIVCRKTKYIYPGGVVKNREKEIQKKSPLVWPIVLLDPFFSILCDFCASGQSTGLNGLKVERKQVVIHHSGLPISLNYGPIQSITNVVTNEEKNELQRRREKLWPLWFALSQSSFISRWEERGHWEKRREKIKWKKIKTRREREGQVAGVTTR